MEPVKLAERRACSAGGVKAACRATSPSLASLQVLPPPGCTSYPLFSDSVIQTCVQHSLHAVVQPRLDGLTERLVGIVGAAQNELRELERCVERSETRLDSRVAAAESKLAVLSDAATRAEQRERDLNTRIAAVAEGLLCRSVEEAQQGARTSAPLTGGQTDLERRVREANARAEAAEESCRKGTKTARRLEDRLEHLEEQSRVMARLGHQMQGLRDELPVARDTVSREASLAMQQQLVTLEEEVRGLTTRVATPDRGHHGCRTLLGALDQRLDCHRVEFDGALTRLGDRCQEVQRQASEQAGRQEEQREEMRQVAEKAQSSAARLDDLNIRVGAFKVRVDSLEGRVAASSERGPREVRRPAESQLQKEFMDRCRAVETMEPRLDDLERRMGKLPEAVDIAVEQALGRHGGHSPARHPPASARRAGRRTSSASGGTPGLGRWDLDPGHLGPS